MSAQDSGGQTRGSRPDQDVEQDTTETGTEAAAAVAERHEKLSEDVDAILDDIDEVLESNSEEFVRSFVQKGGQ